MEGRNQFTFYRSFAEAMRYIRKPADRAKAYDAICDYALYGIEPDMDAMPDSAAIAFELIRPNLDSAKKKSDGGKKTKTSKEDTDKISERYDKQEREKEKEKERDRDRDREQMLLPPTPYADENKARVLHDYLNRVNPSASPRSLEELGGYVEAMGPDVCIRAFDVALDAKKATWPYIRGILRDKQARGVKSLADWDALEQRREATKPTADPSGFTPGEAELNSIEGLKRLRDSLTGDGG